MCHSITRLCVLTNSFLDWEDGYDDYVVSDGLISYTVKYCWGLAGFPWPEKGCLHLKGYCLQVKQLTTCFSAVTVAGAVAVATVCLPSPEGVVQSGAATLTPGK